MTDSPETRAAFTGTTRSGARPLGGAIQSLIIAGWTGRDAAAVEAHIAELERLAAERGPGLGARRGSALRAAPPPVAARTVRRPAPFQRAARPSQPAARRGGSASTVSARNLIA